MSCDERHAHRAAGQAIAAVLVGAPIERVSTNGGSVVEWSPLNPPTPIDSRIRAQIFVLLTGVGAEQRYSFGVPPGDAVWLMPSADQPDLLRDIEQADALSIDLSSLDNSLEMVWQYAPSSSARMSHGAPSNSSPKGSWWGCSTAERCSSFAAQSALPTNARRRQIGGCSWHHFFWGLSGFSRSAGPRFESWCAHHSVR
jgi:hypothetical protein